MPDFQAITEIAAEVATDNKAQFEAEWAEVSRANQADLGCCGGDYNVTAADFED